MNSTTTTRAAKPIRQKACRLVLWQEVRLAKNLAMFMEQWELSVEELAWKASRMPERPRGLCGCQLRAYKRLKAAIRKAVDRVSVWEPAIYAVAAVFGLKDPDKLVKRRWTWLEIERRRQKVYRCRFFQDLVRGPFEGRGSCWNAKPIEGRNYAVWTHNPGGFSRHVYRCVNGDLVYQGATHGHEKQRRASLRIWRHVNGEAVSAC